jgi:hypothetical protein
MPLPATLDERLAPRRPGPLDCGLQHEAGSIQEDDGTTFTPGFFYPRLVFSWPLCNRPLIMFTSMPLWPLSAPLQAAQEMPNACGIIGDAKVALNDGGDARQRPEFIAQAMSAPLDSRVR